MHSVVSSVAIEVLFLSSVAAAEPFIFHSARFADNTVVNLSLAGSRTAQGADYDYDVVITLSETNATGGVVYRDPGRHRALVKCNSPAKVAVRGVDYAIPESGLKGDDWKGDLWRAVCVVPVS
ncbi:hypothetical protein CDO22_34195 (plasmid) [Sinorhizobium meliloti]|nr:hypothetical protein CDO22_34195 [Sinorhizobium meliloti]